MNTAIDLSLKTVSLSDEQLDVVRFVDTGAGNLIVKARAGTGKTFLILQCLPLMNGNVAIMAYGKDIAAEIRAKVAHAGHRNVDVSTFHAMGARILRGILPTSKLEGKGKGQAGFYKFDRIVDELEIPNYLHAFVKKTLSMAMLHGFGVDGLESAKNKNAWYHLVSHYAIDSEIADDNVLMQLKGREAIILEGLRFSYQALLLSKKLAHEVHSYDEMLWLPLILNAKFPTYSWVCVDEAQDSNPVRREIARRMMGSKSRSFFVGDPAQSIFGFTGASVDALGIIERDFSCKVFPMTQTFRCGKAIVALAQSLVPDYRAAPGNHEGEVLSMSEADFNKVDFVPGQDAVICRNTRPLIAAAYNMIKRGIPAHIEGKEIGKGLLMLVNRWASIKTIPTLVSRLNEYKMKEVAKLTADKHEMQADALADKVDSVLAIIDGLPKGATLNDLRDRIESMFADTATGEKAATVTLMTAHRSKGREYLRVFGFGVATYMPSKRATQEHELIQENNLIYVLYTRAMNTYVEVTVG